MKILIIDPKCPYPYDNNTLQTRGLGGTEATVVRVATALSERHLVLVSQHGRTESSVISESLAYVPVAEERQYASQFDHVIFIGKAQNIRELFKRYRDTRWWLWLHNYIVDEVPLHWLDLAIYPFQLVCVSKTHMQHTEVAVRRSGLNRLLLGWLSKRPLTYVYNPVDDGLETDTTPVDSNKLVFFSSPYKGIEQVLKSFDYAFAEMPNLRLYVANPGYTRNFDPAQLDRPGVVVLGSLPQREVLSHVRQACCVFYPQALRPETFGLVYAEANAVGTPVLAHDFGAAREILWSDEQLVNARDQDMVVTRLREWTFGKRPVVQTKPQFRLSNVSQTWETLLCTHS